jgi:hypothetical protein
MSLSTDQFIELLSGGRETRGVEFKAARARAAHDAFETTPLRNAAIMMRSPLTGDLVVFWPRSARRSRMLATSGAQMIIEAMDGCGICHRQQRSRQFESGTCGDALAARVKNSLSLSGCW